MLELGQNLTFVYDGLDTALGDDARLRHLLHGVVLLGLLALDSPNLAKASLANAKMVDEVGLGDSCTQVTI